MTLALTLALCKTCKYPLCTPRCWCGSLVWLWCGAYGTLDVLYYNYFSFYVSTRGARASSHTQGARGGGGRVACVTFMQTRLVAVEHNAITQDVQTRGCVSPDGACFISCGAHEERHLKRKSSFLGFSAT